MAQNFAQYQQNGQSIINNPQTSDPSPQRIGQYYDGAGTAYAQNLLGGGYTVDLGATANLIPSGPTVVPPSPPTGLSATAGNGVLSITFTEGNLGTGTLINYEYSIDGGATFTAFSPAQTTSPVLISGLTNGTTYTVALKTLTTDGTSTASATTTGTPVTTPDAPIITEITAGNQQLSVAFTAPASDGGSAITNYEYSTNNGSTFTAVSPAQTSSPIVITGLTNGTTYSIQIRAVNAVGSGTASTTTTGTPTLGTPLAPVLTAVSSKTTTSITLTFTQATNGTPSITNYKYSVNDGATYTAFSPVDTTSPVTISGLSSNTTYIIRLKAVNINGDSAESNSLTETTYANVNYDRFTSVGASTWTAPAGVNEVEYLVVGGGGGGGASYSNIEVINSVLFQATNPGAGVYWINSTAGSFYGYLFKGASRYTASTPVRLTAPQNITPNGAVYTYNRWYNFEMVYLISNGFPLSTNTTYVLPQGQPTSTYSNNISAGGGGGGGGYIRTTSISPFPRYAVTPGTTYNVYVGAGGAGGTGSAGVENTGVSGEPSYFDTIIALGGDGGKGSRVGFGTNGGGGNSNSDIMGGKGGAGGGRNGGAVVNSEAYQWNTTVLRGTNGGSGVNINFDGAGGVVYSTGGDGGDANTVATSTVPANTGKGGEGTGAELNSYGSGRAGGSGIVIIKYYT